MTSDHSCAFPPRARKYIRNASVTTSDFFRISFRQTSSRAFSISEGTVTEMALYLAEAFIGLILRTLAQAGALVTRPLEPRPPRVRSVRRRPNAARIPASVSKAPRPMPPTASAAVRRAPGTARALSDGRGRRAVSATGRPIARESDRDLEALPTVYTVYGKVPSVSREDNVGQVFSENNQRGVCEVHRAIRI